MASVIALVNHKGGVAKTVSSLNIARALVDSGKRVLAIDLDSQGNLTSDCGVDPYELDEKWRTITMVIRREGTRELRELIIKTPALPALVPAGLSLAEAEIELLARPMGKENVLKRALMTVQDDYDYIIIDCAPSLSQLTYNAFSAANGILIPVQTERKAVLGFASLIKVIMQVKDEINPGLQIVGVLPTLYRKSAREHQEALEALKTYAEQVGCPLFTPIPLATQISRTTNEHVPAVCRSDLKEQSAGYFEIANYLVKNYV